MGRGPGREPGPRFSSGPRGRGGRERRKGPRGNADRSTPCQAPLRHPLFRRPDGPHGPDVPFYRAPGPFSFIVS